VKFSDEQIRDVLELKEDLSEKIIKYKEQIEKLEKNISVLDINLKQSIITKSSDLTRNAPKTIKQERKMQLQKAQMVQPLLMRLLQMMRFQLF